MYLVVKIYNFDHALRHLWLEYIELIEVKTKAIYAYEIAKAHEPRLYQNPNFFNTTKLSKILAKAEQQRQSRLPHEANLKCFDDREECASI